MQDGATHYICNHRISGLLYQLFFVGMKNNLDTL